MRHFLNFSFNRDVRDLLAWADITIADMQTEMQVFNRAQLNIPPSQP